MNSTRIFQFVNEGIFFIVTWLWRGENSNFDYISIDIFFIFKVLSLLITINYN